MNYWLSIKSPEDKFNKDDIIRICVKRLRGHNFLSKMPLGKCKTSETTCGSDPESLFCVPKG